MNFKQTNTYLKLLGVAGVVIAINACSSEPSPWTKNESPWDQRSTTEAEAPAAETYKADLEMPAEPANEVELSYQTESVESFAPEAAVDAEPVEAAAVIAVDEGYAAEGSTIMEHPANYFTMQLIASVDIDRVFRFAEQNNVSTQYVVATVRDGVTCTCFCLMCILIIHQL